MRIIKFCLAILFCLHAQSAKAGDRPTKKMILITVAGAVTIYTAYRYISTPDKKELDQHREKFARLASLRAAQTQEDSDDDGIGTTSYVK